jgi:hypothetical protein
MDTITGPLRGPLRKRESHLWDRHPDDWYVEPTWVSERLFEAEAFDGSIHDPACGQGHIVKSAKAAGYVAAGADLIKRSPECLWQRDWLVEDEFDGPFKNIVSNPPFKLCDDRKAGTHPFVERCLERAERKVALLMPSNWIQGDKRSRWLETTPLYRIYFISPRPSMPPGPALAAGMKPGNGTTDYAWFVWLHGFNGRPTTHWLRRSP